MPTVKCFAVAIGFKFIYRKASFFQFAFVNVVVRCVFIFINEWITLYCIADILAYYLAV